VVISVVTGVDIGVVVGIVVVCLQIVISQVEKKHNEKKLTKLLLPLPTSVAVVVQVEDEGGDTASRRQSQVVVTMWCYYVTPCSENM
jgi:hypothetical protein